MDEASRVWDAVVRGTAADATAFDPTLVETIRRLQLLGEQLHTDPRFAAQLEETLMHAMNPTPVAPSPLGRTLTTVPNGRSPRGVLREAPLHRDAPHAHGALAYLATAALILLTLIASYVVFGSTWRLGREDDDPAVIPALVGTPEASPVPGLTEDTVVFHQTFDAIPASGWVGVERTTLGPGAVMKQGTPSTSGVGPMLYRVEVGSVTGQADGPVTVTGAGVSVVQVAPGTDIVLDTGDVAFVPAGVVSQWRNEGTSPATVLDAGIATPGIDAPGWAEGTVLSYQALIDDWPVKPPSPRGEFTVRRLTLAPGASLPNRPEVGLKLVGVESGVMTGIRSKRSQPTVEIHADQYRAGSWVDVNSEIRILNELRNDGSEPLTVLVLSVVPLEGSAATPIATPTTGSS
jgi:quercetin dioxygenase-like cupin family protein